MPGHNNWFQINLKLGLDNKKLPFEMELNIPSSLDMNFTSASDTTANLIANKFDNLYLSLSGGVDSEYVASVFLRNKIDFKAITVKSNRNLTELWHAKHFCKKHNLDLIVVDYSNQNKELLKKIFKYSNAIKMHPCLSFFPHVIADYILNKNGSLVTGYGDCFNTSNDYDINFEDELEIEEHAYYLDVNFLDRHPGAFFSYTPDIFFSLIKHMPTGINIHAAKENLYRVPGRSKQFCGLEVPNIVPERIREGKNCDLACIKYSKKDLLNRIKIESKILLSAN
jgi:hypothetical protein